MEYILLKNQIQDKQLYEKTIALINDRMNNLIEKKLGVHGTSYDKIKIQVSSFGDKFLSTFAELERLDNDRELAVGQLNLINNFLYEIDQKIRTMRSKEKEIFRLKYIHGLSNKEIEERGIACDKTIRTYLKEIDKK